MSFENVNFSANPSFKFKEIVVEKTECLGGTYQYDCFKGDDGETYLISPYWDIDNIEKREHHISIINLRTRETRVLNGHKDRVLTVRYFQDPYTKKHYLISADRKTRVLVWDLSDNYKIILDTELKYESFIYSVLLFFEENKIYAVTSTLSNGETFVIPLDDKEHKIEIPNTKDFNIYFLTYWWDEKNKEHNIIQCGKNKIKISQFKARTDFEFQTDDKHPYNMDGMVFKNKGKDYLITSATYGLIKVIDLEERREIVSMTFDDVFFCSFVRWNDYYILLNDKLQRRILVLDMENNYQVISKVLLPEMYHDKFIKKIDHPKYGESLLSVGIDWKLKLFVNRTITSDDIPASQ